MTKVERENKMAFAIWSQHTTHNGRKVVTDKHKIHKRLMQHNSACLSMSGDPPIVQGSTVDEIWRYGESNDEEKILNGTFDVDKHGLDEVLSLKEMTSIIAALKTRKLAKLGTSVPEINT